MDTLPANLEQNLINFKAVFLSIIIEALPFVLVGVFVSAIINTFVSEQVIQRVLPRNRFLSVIFASLLGMIFPLCDCGIVPVARRLVAKGVPLHTAVSFMLAAPIVNPVVIVATAVAFNDAKCQIAILRVVTSLLVTWGTAMVVSCLFERSELKAHHDNYSCSCGCDHHHETDSLGGIAKIIAVLRDGCEEFFSMGKYLILGAMLSTILQTVVDRRAIESITYSDAASIVVMIVFACIVSVCSTADAFIAASLRSTFPMGALLAFMVFGPMIDIKNLLMLGHSFRFRFVVITASVVAVLCGGITYVFSIFLL